MTSPDWAVLNHGQHILFARIGAGRQFELSQSTLCLIGRLDLKLSCFPTLGLHASGNHKV